MGNAFVSLSVLHYFSALVIEQLTYTASTGQLGSARASAALMFVRGWWKNNGVSSKDHGDVHTILTYISNSDTSASVEPE